MQADLERLHKYMLDMDRGPRRAPLFSEPEINHFVMAVTSLTLGRLIRWCHGSTGDHGKKAPVKGLAQSAARQNHESMDRRTTARTSSSSKRPMAWRSRSQCQRGAGLPSWSTSKTRCPTGSRCRMSLGPFQEPFTGQKPFSKRPDRRGNRWTGLAPAPGDCREDQLSWSAAAEVTLELYHSRPEPSGYYLRRYGFFAAVSRHC
jgi:hypothetical protein